MKTLFKYLLMSMPLAVSLLLMTACNDDESVDPYDINYVYIYFPVSTENTLEYKGNGTFLVDIAPECIVNPVRCTKPAPTDLTIHINVDPSLVDSYNQANGTNYTLLKSVQLENATLHIKKGEYISADSLKVHYTDMTEFQSGAENYLLPIAITSIEGSGASISENSKIYLTFSSIYKVNTVTMGASKSMNLEYENGGFTNLTERLELENMLTADWAADDDINISLEMDPSLIGAYNAVNGTNYVLMPNTAFEHSTVTIKKGARTPQEKVALTFSDAMAAVNLGENYILPIVISEVNGVGAGIGKTTTAYLVFRTVEKLSLSVENVPVGTAINDFTGWNITVNGSATGANWGDSWMGLVTSPGNYVDYMEAFEPLEIDMGKLETVSAIQIQYYSSSYSPSSTTTIEVSSDGINYKVGQCELTAARAHTLVFQYPAEVRYIRVTYSATGRYGTLLTAVNVYTSTDE